MNAGLDVPNLKNTLAKKPKSLLFARLADELRAESLGAKDKLDEAFEIANNGLLANPNFLQGRLVRGRIFFDKEDYANAKTDFEFVVDRDPFCLSAQKLLLESLAKLGKSPQTELHAKILNNFEPDMHSGLLNGMAAAVASDKPKPDNSVKPVNKSINSALDDILKEDLDLDSETELRGAMLNTFKKIFEKLLSQKALPEAKSNEPDEPEPELMPYVPPEQHKQESPAPSPIEAVSAAAAVAPIASVAPAAPIEEVAQETKAPSLDDILGEQLAPKVADGDMPDLTGDMKELLAAVTESKDSSEPEPELMPYVPPEQSSPQPLSESEPEPEPMSVPKIEPEPEPEPKLELASLTGFQNEAPIEKSIGGNAPSLDDILSEQLAPKVADGDMPDLTGDMDALLASAPPIQEQEPELNLEPTSLSSPPLGNAPNLDDILSEQLAPKVADGDMPDLTGDMDALLASAPPIQEQELNLEPTSLSSPPLGNAPNLDDILSEQLAPKVADEDMPDLTGDMDALLAKASEQEASAEAEPELMPYVPSEKLAEPSAPSAPNLDDILSEQLAPKVADGDMPDLTGDMDALLAKVSEQEASAEAEPELMPYVPPEKPAEPSAPSAPNLDDILSEQLASKVEDADMPNLMGDMDALLAEVSKHTDSSEPEPELMPYVPPEQPGLPDDLKGFEDVMGQISTPSLDDILNEQLADKVDKGSLPDLTNDINALLDETDEPVPSQEDTLAQNPTPTLAELYLSQNLPQKAAEVYKKLLVQNPGDADLQAKLTQAEAQIRA